ncbi:MAG: phosphopantothenoylcysteine decarboxylase [Candidatus Omnitrophota bacterium]
MSEASMVRRCGTRRFSRVLVTAGPTRERLDSVRYISNFSTGNMGYALAAASLDKGYKVTLISGPTQLKRPKGARFIPVEDASEMERAVKANIKKADCLFMAGAVSDWRPTKRISGKIRKAGKKSMTLRLVPNPDILREIGRAKGKKLIAGFALESSEADKRAEAKLKDKNLDLIVANSVGKKTPFGSGKTDVTIIDRRGKRERIEGATKKNIARKILKRAERLWREER